MNGHNPNLPNLENEKRVAILPLGGATLKQWVDKYYSENLQLPEVHIYDRDTSTPPTYQSAVDTVNARSNNSWATLINKREIENYIHPDAISSIFGISISFSDTDDVPELVATAVNLDTSNPFYRIGTSRAKRLINELATKQMNITRINAIDSANEIETWLTEIANRLN